MRIEHVALWTARLEELRDFYTGFFGAQAGARYVNPSTGFESYFLSFESGARLEIMRRADILTRASAPGQALLGWAHIAISVGSQQAVDALTERLRAAGYPIIGEPRWTGDGYYESVVLDTDGNSVEITV